MAVLGQIVWAAALLVWQQWQPQAQGCPCCCYKACCYLAVHLQQLVVRLLLMLLPVQLKLGSGLLLVSWVQLGRQGLLQPQSLPGLPSAGPGSRLRCPHSQLAAHLYKTAGRACILTCDHWQSVMLRSSHAVC